MDDLSRFETHKRLGTWHFDLNSTKQDYTTVYNFDRRAGYWEYGIEEVLEEGKRQRIDNKLLSGGDYFKKIEKSDDVYDICSKSIYVDQIKTGAPLIDNWHDLIQIDENFVFWELAEFFDLDCMDAKIAVQHPMDATYRHIDHDHQHISKHKPGKRDYQSIEECFKSKGEWDKYIIFLNELKPGQVFYWGNSIVKPKCGDTITWDHGVPHWTVNFSDEPRYTLMVHGKRKD